MLCKPAYCSTLLACLPRLLELCPVLAGVDLCSTSEMPMFKTLQRAYDTLGAVRQQVADRYDGDFDGRPFHTLRRDTHDGHYHPDQLPRQLPAISAVLDPQSKQSHPPQRMLTRIMHHAQWLANIDAANLADVNEPHPSIPHCEASRYISVSQPTSAGTIDIVPDGTWATTVDNRTLSTYLEFRHGLNISAASSVHDAAAARGDIVDRRGHAEANTADHNRRHNGVLNKGYDMLLAVAVGQVVKGDKADKSQMAELNEGTITDLCELEGDEDTGADCHVEVKVPSPCSASAYKVGLGTKTGGGCYASVGHLYALGNTEERYRNGILGVKQKGRKCEGPFNHATGRGYVKAQKGKYRHALAQGARVTPLIVETTGAISPRACAYIAYLARRARGSRARDGTTYGRLRASPTSFFVHHTQRLSKAAACGNVDGIHKMIQAAKQSAAARARGAQERDA